MKNSPKPHPANPAVLYLSTANIRFHDFQQTGNRAFACTLALQRLDASIFNMKNWFDIQRRTKKGGRTTDASPLIQIL